MNFVAASSCRRHMALPDLEERSGRFPPGLI
jgi:hypothetical protein